MKIKWSHKPVSTLLKERLRDRRAALARGAEITPDSHLRSPISLAMEVSFNALIYRTFD
jgi:hypothetical protein